MIEYHIQSDGNDGLGREGVLVTVKLQPRTTDATHTKQLALALLNLLRFDANVQNGAHGRGVVGLTFFNPKNEATSHIGCRFKLRFADPEEIARIANQAQQYLERRLTEAVDTFSMVLAVGSVDPYMTRLRIQHGALVAAAAHDAATKSS